MALFERAFTRIPGISPLTPSTPAPNPLAQIIEAARRKTEALPVLGANSNPPPAPTPAPSIPVQVGGLFGKINNAIEASFAEAGEAVEDVIDTKKRQETLKMALIAGVAVLVLYAVLR